MTLTLRALRPQLDGPIVRGREQRAIRGMAADGDDRPLVRLPPRELLPLDQVPRVQRALL